MCPILLCNLSHLSSFHDATCLRLHQSQTNDNLRISVSQTKNKQNTHFFFLYKVSALGILLPQQKTEGYIITFILYFEVVWSRNTLFVVLYVTLFRQRKSLSQWALCLLGQCWYQPQEPSFHGYCVYSILLPCLKQD